MLIAVDADDTALGPVTRSASHAGDGVLHRAFSIYLFDAAGRLLLQQRSAAKQLWPLYWANSCCSHPRWGEDIDAAAQRRLREELGLQTTLRRLFKFEYYAPFGEQGCERELCSVYIGRTERVGSADPAEVADWAFVESDVLDHRLATEPQIYTPWLHLAWQRLRGECWDEVAGLCATP